MKSNICRSWHSYIFHQQITGLLKGCIQCISQVTVFVLGLLTVASLFFDPRLIVTHSVIFDMLWPALPRSCWCASPGILSLVREESRDFLCPGLCHPGLVKASLGPFVWQHSPTLPWRCQALGIVSCIRITQNFSAKMHVRQGARARPSQDLLHSHQCPYLMVPMAALAYQPQKGQPMGSRSLSP